MTSYKPKTSNYADQGYYVLLALRPTVDGNVDLTGQPTVVASIDRNPEGFELGSPGDLRLRRDTGQLWIKATGVNTREGWVLLGGSGGGGGQFGSVGYEFTPTALPGSNAGYVDMLGPGVLDTPVGFNQAGNGNALEYTGAEAATFFVQVRASLQAGSLDLQLMHLRITVNDVAVPQSDNVIAIATLHGQPMNTTAQVTLSPGDVVTAQVFFEAADADGVVSTYQMQILEV